MFFLTLCLIGFAAAAPAIPAAPFLPEPILPAESHFLVSPYIGYPAPLAPFRALEIKIEPEPKEEYAELPEPKEEDAELPEPKEEIEEPKEETEEPKELVEEPKPKPTVVKLDVPKPPTFITDFFANLPFNFPHIPYLSNWLSSKPTTPPRLYYPAYYPGYPGAVVIESPKV